MELRLFLFLILQPISWCVYDTTIVFSPDDLTMVQKIVNGTRKKAILRYGFHRTSECQDFEKAYICIQKCLDFNYDIAYADGNCYCTCYVNKDKAKYSAFIPGQDKKWKLGAPTTKLPVWAQKKKTDQKPLGAYPDDEHSEMEDFPGNETETIASNNTLVDKSNTTQIGIDVENINVDSNSTKSDNSSSIGDSVAKDQNTNTTDATEAVPKTTI